jgi:large subunit ribosomal protein L18e
MKRKKTNPHILTTINTLYETSRKHDVALWKTVARKLERPYNNWAEVNVGKIVTHLKKGEIALVPGKVLGMGESDKIKVAAWKFSDMARKKIEKAGGKCYSIIELIKKNPKGSKVRIIGG